MACLILTGSGEENVDGSVAPLLISLLMSYKISLSLSVSESLLDCELELVSHFLCFLEVFLTFFLHSALLLYEDFRVSSRDCLTLKETKML